MRSKDQGSDQRLQHLVQLLVKGSIEISLEFHSGLIPDLYCHLLGATVIEIWDQLSKTLLDTVREECIDRYRSGLCLVKDQRAKSERVKFWEPLSENLL